MSAFPKCLKEAVGCTVHCSNLLPALLKRAELRSRVAALQAQRSGGPDDDEESEVEDAMKSAIWQCSSATNGKRWVEGQPRGPGADAVRVWGVVGEAVAAFARGVVAQRVPARADAA